MKVKFYVGGHPAIKSGETFGTVVKAEPNGLFGVTYTILTDGGYTIETEHYNVRLI